MHIHQIVDEVMNLAGMKNDFVYYSMSPFDLQEYILDHTLPEYSRILPYMEDVMIKLRDEDILERGINNNMSPGRVVYALPVELREASKKGLQIFSVGNLEEIPGSATTGMGIPAGLGMFNYSAQDLYNVNLPVQAYRAQSAAFAIPRYTCSYNSGKLIIDNGHGLINEGAHYKVRVSYFHSRNLKTLSEGMYSTFRQLAYYDVVSYILDNELKYMDQINVGNSSTDLKLQLYEEVQSDRLKFLEDMRAKKVYDSAMSLITTM